MHNIIVSAPRIVLTGAPCSGKTTLINMLAERGFKIVPEAAAQALGSGARFDPKHPTEFQWDVFWRQILNEQIAAGMTGGPIFFDRGLFDGIAYCRAYQRPVPIFLGHSRLRRYDRVFLLAPLPWRTDGVRYEDQAFQQLVTPLLQAAYEETGHEVIHLPVMAPNERLSAILEYCQPELTLRGHSIAHAAATPSAVAC